MSATKKRVLSFQTPKKKAMTPLRPNSKSTKHTSIPIQNISQSNSDEDIENKLISAYREENNFLRNLKSQSYLYSKLLGIDIDQEGNTINFSIRRNSTSGNKKLDFFLEKVNFSRFMVKISSARKRYAPGQIR